MSLQAANSTNLKKVQDVKHGSLNGNCRDGAQFQVFDMWPILRNRGTPVVQEVLDEHEANDVIGVVVPADRSGRAQNLLAALRRWLLPPPLPGLLAGSAGVVLVSQSTELHPALESNLGAAGYGGIA